MAPTDEKTEVVLPAEVPDDLPLPSDQKAACRRIAAQGEPLWKTTRSAEKSFANGWPFRRTSDRPKNRWRHSPKRRYSAATWTRWRRCPHFAIAKRGQIFQKNAIMRISMLCRVGASGGVLGSSKALCPRKRARPSVSDSYVLSSSTFSGNILGKYHQRCDAE
jgi:hypothetical protein